MPSSSHSVRAASTTPSSNTRSMSMSAIGLAGNRAVAAIEHAVDAADQPFEGGTVELIGASETMDHARLRRFASAFQTLSARA